MHVQSRHAHKGFKNPPHTHTHTKTRQQQDNLICAHASSRERRCLSRSDPSPVTSSVSVTAGEKRSLQQLTDAGARGTELESRSRTVEDLSVHQLVVVQQQNLVSVLGRGCGDGWGWGWLGVIPGRISF